MQGNFSGFTTGSMTNVEKVVLTNEGNIARSFSAKGIDGVNTWTLNDTGAAVNLTDLSAAGATVNVQGLKAGPTSIGFTADAVKGDNDSLTLGLNNVGTAKDGDTAAKHVAITANGIENLAVKATDDNYVDLSAAASKTVTVSGSGNLDVNNVAAGMTSFDASALSGNVTADLHAATGLAIVKGGSGDDTITVTNLAANAVIEGGAGNDSLILQGVTSTLQPTMSGFENITADGGTLTLSGKNMSDFNSLTVKNDAQVTLANMDASAFTVTASGFTAGSVLLSDATALTYNTVSSKTDKTSDSISTTVAASKATSATVNVGEYTEVGGTLNFGAAVDVAVNVASGLGSDGKTEMTSFGGILTANKAQSFTVNAEGLLKASTFNVDAASSVLVDAAQGSMGVVKIQASKATDVSITAGSAMDITGSSFSSAQNVTLAANKGHLSGGVALDAVNQLTLSGADAASQITLGVLGSSTQEYGITVDASGLKGGLALGNTDAGTGDVALNLASMTGAAAVGTVEGNNVTIHAAQLGTTTVGAITATGDVNIDAMGVLGGNATAAAFTAGAIAADKAITVNFDGSSDMTFGALTADTVNLDASGYQGAITDSNGAVVDAAIGAITADTVVIKGSEIGANTFGSAANTDNFITADTLTYTGGLDVDTVYLTSKGADTMNVSLDTGAGDDVVGLTAINSTTKITVTGDMGGNNGDDITVDGSASINGININLSGLTGYSTSELSAKAAGSALVGGSGVDSLTVGGATAASAKGVLEYSMTGGAGIDTFNVDAAVTKGINHVTITDYESGIDILKGFSGEDSYSNANDAAVALQTFLGGTISASDIQYTVGNEAIVYNGNTYLLSADTADDVTSIVELHGVQDLDASISA